ncbi:MAG: hypothetical protein NC311_18745, partial [Muribaculaceae bacterium]|nr:hypothetical protein [Muribaculaceae bacterium]
MNNSKHIIALSLALTATLCAAAQDLKKEITIEKEIVPELRAATRLSVNHESVALNVKKSSIQMSDRVVPVGLVPSMTRLNPAKTVAAIDVSDYRGYVDLGYFPAYNLGLSAGYRFIDTSSTCLGAWLQFDGFKYDRDRTVSVDDLLNVTDSYDMGENTIMAGVAFNRYFNEAQSLRIDAGLGYSAMKFHHAVEQSLQQQQDDELDVVIPVNGKSGNLRFNLDARWTSGDEINGYTAAIGFGMFDNRDDKNAGTYGLTSFHSDMISPVRELSYGADFGIKYGDLAIGVDASFLNYNHMNSLALIPDELTSVSPEILLPGIKDGKGKTSGVVSVRPNFTFNYDMLTAKIGANMQYTVNSGKNFHVAPDIDIDFVPSPKFAVNARLGGGEYQNTLGSVFNLTHYMSPQLTYENSHIPFIADLNLVTGPFAGASLEIFGGYAVANDWLMPVVAGYGAAFVPVDIKGWHAGAKAAYNWRNLAEASASVEFAPEKSNRGYYLWRDHASRVMKFALSGRPV